MKSRANTVKTKSLVFSVACCSSRTWVTCCFSCFHFWGGRSTSDAPGNGWFQRELLMGVAHPGCVHRSCEQIPPFLTRVFYREITSAHVFCDSWGWQMWGQRGLLLVLSLNAEHRSCLTCLRTSMLILSTPLSTEGVTPAWPQDFRTSEELERKLMYFSPFPWLHSIYNWVTQNDK